MLHRQQPVWPGRTQVDAAENRNAKGRAELLHGVEQAGRRADLLRADDVQRGGEEGGVNSPIPAVNTLAMTAITAIETEPILRTLKAVAPLPAARF